MPRQSTNLYDPPTKGYYIYKSKVRYNKYNAQRKWPSGFTKTWTFYTLEEAMECLRNCPDEGNCQKLVHTWADMVV